MVTTSNGPGWQPLQNAREYFTLHKQEVLDIFSVGGDINVVVNAFYPELPGRKFKSRRKLI